MSEDQLYENLPADPEQAFLKLEESFREECDAKIFQLNREERSSDSAYFSYIKKVIVAASEFGLDIGFDDEFPRIQNINFEICQNYVSDIDSYILKLKLRNGRRAQGYSVRFDTATKQKMRHHLTQVRSIVDILEVDQKKKDALYLKISALEQEVDRDRTRFDVYAAFIIEATSVTGDAIKKLEPLRKWVDSITQLISVAKNEEETKQLPSPPERKQIEPPRSEDSFGDFNDGDEKPPSGFDDKVPF